MIPIKWVIATYVYLYEPCKYHNQCLNPNDRDEEFLKECQFISESASWCTTDVLNRVFAIIYGKEKF